MYSPCGSAPPLLSLTRIASIPALVKLTSSLNYANKAIVICICTAARGVGALMAGGGGHGWNPLMLRGQLIKAPPHVKVPVCTHKQTYIHTLRKKNTYLRIHMAWVDEWRQHKGPASELRSVSALKFLTVPGFIDFSLNGWCRCRAQTSALLSQCNILLGNKHQPGCQHKQLLLFKVVSVKGDELEWPGWCNEVGGLKLFTLFTVCELRGLINWIYLFYSLHMNRTLTTEVMLSFMKLCKATIY